jgi:hypothetical protein
VRQQQQEQEQEQEQEQGGEIGHVFELMQGLQRRGRALWRGCVQVPAAEVGNLE